jgi:tetratricopeptide (TPR) repeat protein
VDLSQACAKIVSGDDIVGSAFFVAPDTLITCAHNVAHISVGESVSLSYLGEIVDARVTHKDPEVFSEHFPPWPFPDLAVLQVDGEIGTAIPLCDGIPPPREVELHSFGFHLAGELGGESLVLKYGLLGYADDHREEPRLMLHGAIPLGYSGAPVWINGEDCVVGMITYTDHENLSGGATPSVELVKSTTVLEKYLRREQPALQLDETLRLTEIPVDSVSAPVPSPRRMSEQVARMREVPHDPPTGTVAESPLPLRPEPEISADTSLQNAGDGAIAALLDKADGERRRGHFQLSRSYVAQALADEIFEHATREMRARALRAEATSRLDLESDWPGAEAFAKLARDLAGDSPHQRILESSIVALRDGPEEALGVLRGESAKEIVMWAGYALQLKRIADCIAALDSLPPADQDIGNVQRLLSLANAFQRDQDAALRHAQRALRLSPEDVRVQFVAGFVLTMSAFPASLWPDELMSWPQPLHPDMVVTGEGISKALQQAVDIFDGILADSDVQGMEREHIEIWKLASYALDPKRHDAASSYAKALVERSTPNFRAIPWVQMMRLSIDVAPTLRLIEERIESKTAIAEEVLVVATEALRAGNPSRAESILRENVQAFEGEYADARRRFFLIESLIDQNRFSDAREEATSLSLGRDEVMLMIAQAESAVSKDTATVKLELESSYARTHNPMFLVNRCDIASVEKDWQYIADRAEELLSSVDTVVAARLAIYGCYNAGRNQEARKLASEYAERHPGNVPPDLTRIEALARERLGDPSAIDLFNRLVEAEPTERNILLLGNILIMHGDFAAVDVLARRLSNLSNLSAETALRFATWLRLQNREMAIELWRAAIRQEVPDEFVLLAYTLAMQLGVESEAESIRAAMQRLGAAKEHGVSLLPQAEAIEALRRSVERNAEIGQSYRRGEIPVHFLCSVTNANLVKTHAVIPKRNSERKPQDWTAVYVRHGGRRSVPETHLPTGRPLVDATSYLLAEQYGVTDSIISTFGGIYVADNLAAILTAALADSMPCS